MVALGIFKNCCSTAAGLAVTLTRLVASGNVRGMNHLAGRMATQHGLPPTPRTALTTTQRAGRTLSLFLNRASLKLGLIDAALCMRGTALRREQDNSATLRIAALSKSPYGASGLALPRLRRPN